MLKIREGEFMFNLYIISVGVYWFSLILFLIRLFATRKQINFKGNKEHWFIYIRLIVASIIPIVNLVIGIWSIYLSILMEDKKFIEYMNE